MDGNFGLRPRSKGLRALAWMIRVLCLPVALLAAMHPPNEYRATLGISALDCDGPFETYVLAVPALLIYGAGALANAMRWRRWINGVAALLCVALCAAIALNLARAVEEHIRQAESCR